jgi:hypothetical protein
LAGPGIFIFRKIAATTTAPGTPAASIVTAVTILVIPFSGTSLFGGASFGGDRRRQGRGRDFFFLFVVFDGRFRNFGQAIDVAVGGRFGCRGELLGRPVAPLATPASFGADGLFVYGINIFPMFFEKIGDIEEGVAFQAEVHEGGLHAGQDPRDAAFVNAAGERILVGALKINFYQLILFEDSYFSLMAIGANHQFLTHFITAFRGR